MRLPSRGSGASTADPIRVLILEDSPLDAELMLGVLRQSGFDPSWELVDNEQQFVAHLAPALDLILSDYALPQYSGLHALDLVRSRGLDVPFILVSGRIGEETAVEAMRNGADDYLLKDRMGRLGQAVRQALERRRLRMQSEHAESARRESEERFRQLAENIKEVFWLTDPSRNEWLYVSPAYREISGRSCESLSESPRAWLEAIHPDDRERVLEAVQTKQVRGDYVEEYRIFRPDGTIRWIRDRAFPISGKDGRVFRIAGVAEDITERKAQEQKVEKLSRIRAFSSEINAATIRIREREALLQETCRIAARHGKFDLVWVALLDAEKREVRALAWAGCSPECAHAVSWASTSDPRETLSEVLRTRRLAVRNDIGMEPLAGSLRQEALSKGCRSTVCLPFLVDDEVVAATILFATGEGFFDEDELALLNEVAADVSFALQYISKQERLEYLAYYDALTGLPNRTLFIDRVGQQMHARGSEPLMVALILLNLERFRNINETFGRRGGDELLKQVALRLESAFHGKDFIARIGADGFSVLLCGIRDAAAVASIVENQLLDCFRGPYQLDDIELRVAARAGIALFPGDGGDADALFRNAEAALKRAKDAGERYLFYAAEMNARAAQALSLETRLRKAVDAREFVLHYQPKIDLASNAICGLEALIRWQEPGGALVLPGDFIPLLEETGLILEVGKWVLTQALADHRAMTARGCTVPRVAVNVSSKQLERAEFVDTVISAVQEGGNPDALELEITESLMMRDVETSIHKLSKLRRMGIRIDMDDFGTGYSSLSYLAQLPISSLKIDRSFVNAMAVGNQDQVIISTIIALAHSLSLTVVAEGVGAEYQAQLLSSMMCDEAQGYLYSRPVPVGEIETLLRSTSLASRARRSRPEDALWT